MGWRVINVEKWNREEERERRIGMWTEGQKDNGRVWE